MLIFSKWTAMKEQVWTVYVHKNSVFIIKFYILSVCENSVNILLHFWNWIVSCKVSRVRLPREILEGVFFKEKYCFYFFTLFYPILIFDQSGKVLLTLDHWNLKLCTFYKQLKNITNEREKILFKNTYRVRTSNTVYEYYLLSLCPALHASALSGHASSVKLLLDHGAQIDAVDRLKHTALFRACEMGHTSVVQSLIDYGARVDVLDFDGRSPLHW